MYRVLTRHSGSADRLGFGPCPFFGADCFRGPGESDDRRSRTHRRTAHTGARCSLQQLQFMYAFLPRHCKYISLRPIGRQRVWWVSRL
jgi:hypothetical protein